MSGKVSLNPLLSKLSFHKLYTVLTELKYDWYDEVAVIVFKLPPAFGKESLIATLGPLPCYLYFRQKHLKHAFKKQERLLICIWKSLSLSLATTVNTRTGFTPGCIHIHVHVGPLQRIQPCCTQDRPWHTCTCTLHAQTLSIEKSYQTNQNTLYKH